MNRPPCRLTYETDSRIYECPELVTTTYCRGRSVHYEFVTWRGENRLAAWIMRPSGLEFLGTGREIESSLPAEEG
jgi:hypothetical protein